jgi:hypothetical protein
VRFKFVADELLRCLTRRQEEFPVNSIDSDQDGFVFNFDAFDPDTLAFGLKLAFLAHFKGAIVDDGEPPGTGSRDSLQQEVRGIFNDGNNLFELRPSASGAREKWVLSNGHIIHEKRLGKGSRLLRRGWGLGSVSSETDKEQEQEPKTGLRQCCAISHRFNQ